MPKMREGKNPDYHLCSSAIELEQHDGAECEQACEEVEDASFFHRVAVREQVAQREEDESNEEIRDPCAHNVGQRLRTIDNTKITSQLRERPIEESAETA